MTFVKDLESHIHESYQLIRQYEDIIQTSSDPIEKRRSQRMIQQQRDLVRGYLADYVPLCQRLNAPIPPDIAEIAIGLGTELPALGSR